tara:strand:+ start:199 stop:396 length:198 start_codon:yes stop_codon:yes gene_type:complete
MIGLNYKTKKELKASIGQSLSYEETTMFGVEYVSNGKLTGVGPSPYIRKWYATVTLEDDKIVKVS